ncbi:MAG: sulfite exporter TauE/SafE family protein [Salibacteraceae bacterium]
MTINEILILACIGFAAGAFSGMFGIGGGLIMVPAMVFFLGMAQHTAQGTSLGVLVIPVAAIAAFNYYKEGQLNIKFAAIVALTFIVGGYFGSKLSLGLSELMLKRLFGVLMLAMAIKLIFFSKADPV